MKTNKKYKYSSWESEWLNDFAWTRGEGRGPKLPTCSMPVLSAFHAGESGGRRAGSTNGKNQPNVERKESWSHLSEGRVTMFKMGWVLKTVCLVGEWVRKRDFFPKEGLGRRGNFIPIEFGIYYFIYKVVFVCLHIHVIDLHQSLLQINSVVLNLILKGRK